MNRPLLKRFLIIIAVLAIAIYHFWPPQEKIRLGLDLQGGSAFTLKVDLSQIKGTDQREAAIQKTIEIIRKRIDQYGVGEVLIQPSGEDRILVQIPGLKEEQKASATSQLKRVAFLEFRLVHPQNEEELAKIKTQNAPIPAGYELLTLSEGEKPGQTTVKEELLVKKRAELTGKDLVEAGVIQTPGGFQVEFELNDRGGEIFKKITRAHKKERLAIVLDGKLTSAPRINEEIGKRGVITGNFNYREAFDLANALQNPLETPLEIESEWSVDPSLGADSIRSGFISGVIALSLVVLFMWGYYFLAGLVANIALFLNIILIFGVLSIFNFTLTLPGLAGLILTVGIAVDANVLIFERIREEIKKGKALVPAINAGFDRAFGTIIDANVTTLITALVLAWLGTGPVQGFGYTLSAGIVTSVFAATFVSRFIFDFLLRFTQIQKLTMLSIVKETKISFLNFKWPAIALSAAIILAGAFVALKKGKDIYGVEFLGGDALTMQFSKRVDESLIRKKLEEAGIRDAFIQYQHAVLTNLGRTAEKETGESLLVRVPFNEGERVAKILTEAFPEAGFAKPISNRVGSNVGDELKQTAIKGLVVAAFCILVYITLRFEFAFAVGAIIALIHDVLICLAFFFFTDRQLSLPAVGALLTIAGYSLNDTIVVFDRIREEIKLKGGKLSFAQLTNLSINETLSRTLLTSLTTLIASLALYLFGGGVINDFAFILVVGVIAGTYSSIFIASPILLLWHPSKLGQQSSETEDQKKASALS